MCDACWREFRGWAAAFTRAERALAALQALLLAALVALIVLLALHLAVCETRAPRAVLSPPNAATPATDPAHADGGDVTTGTAATIPLTSGDSATGKTVDPDLECSWTPSAKTTALTRHYEHGPPHATIASAPTSTRKQLRQTTPAFADVRYDSIVEEFDQEEQSDGEEAGEALAAHAAALVRPRPPADAVFGCVLSVVAARWALTAASCLEAIEEVDALDSFVIMEAYGARAPRAVGVADVRVHGAYGGERRAHDLAALRSAAALGARPLRLPPPLCRAALAPGERLHLLGYGPYRSVEAGAGGRRLRRAAVHVLPGAQCGGASGGAGAAWALRHLAHGEEAAGAACGAAPLCAGALFARGLPCNYCSGSPLVAEAAGGAGGALLLGLMSDDGQCGVACEPQLFVDVAAARDWIESVINSE